MRLVRNEPMAAVLGDAGLWFAPNGAATAAVTVAAAAAAAAAACTRRYTSTKSSLSVLLMCNSAETSASRVIHAGSGSERAMGTM